MNKPRFNLTKEEQRIFERLNSPSKIQDYLNTIPINFEKKGDTAMSPRRVLKEKKAHCLEGAMFASAVLWYHGKKPVLLDLKSTKEDYDHVVAIFKEDGRYGAISKTNHAVLRYREPIFRTIRELALSYFHEYFNNKGIKTLRSYSKPFSLSKYGHAWITATEDLYEIGAELDDIKHFPILTKSNIKKLRTADKIEIKAGLLTEYKE